MRFSLDIHIAPNRQDYYLTPGDAGRLRIPVEGLEVTDVVEQAAFTSKRVPTDADAAGTTIQLVVDRLSTGDQGFVETLVGVQYVQFDFTPADSAKLLQMRDHEVRLWIRRGGYVYFRAWVTGMLTPYPSVTALSLVV